MNVKKEMTNVEWTQLVLGAAILFGSIIRFFPGLVAGFPLNDGGMFLSMIQDLGASQYRLPEFTSYNVLGIPFAYPPLGFYIGRMISDLLNISELDVLRWLPPFINSLSILAFYFLTSDLLRSKPLGALASAFYALTPGAFGWFVMGGGLTRSFGSLFLLLSVFFVLKMFRAGEGKTIGLAILFSGLTVLSHPEAGIHAAVTCILLWAFHGRTVKSLIHSIFVGVGVLVLTSPWWLTVISYHGLSPFLSALHTGSYGTPLGFALYKLILGDGIFPILAALRLIGLGWGLWRRQYFLLAWTILPYLIEPRSAPSVAFYPLTMLVALAFAEALPYLIARIFKKEIDDSGLYKNRPYNFFLFLTIIFLFIDSGLYGFRLVGNSLRSADLDGMTWIAENTPVDAQFLLLTGVQSPEIDPFIEWFPALTGRRSQSTIQGLEWLLNEGFYERYTDLAELQACETVECVSDFSSRTGLGFDYVVIQDPGDRGESIVDSFHETGAFERIYSNSAIIVLAMNEK